MAQAAGPIRAFVLPNGRIRLWLHGAPTVTAKNAAGWKVDPAGSEKNKTWLDQLKKLGGATGTSPWKALLDSLARGDKVAGVDLLQPLAKLTVETDAAGAATLNAEDSKGKQVTAKFSSKGSGLTSVDSALIEQFLDTAVGSKPLALEAALSYAAALPAPKVADPDRVLSAYVGSALHAGNSASPLLLETDAGPAVIAVHVATPPVAKITTEPTATKQEPSIEPKPKWDAPFWPIPLAAFIGATLGFAIRSLIRPKKTPPVPPSRNAQDLAAKLAQREDELARAKTALEQTKTAAKEFRDQHGAWVRDRDETLQTLAEERSARAQADAATVQAKKSEAEAKRVQQELGRQVESLQKSGQKAQSEATKARAYADFDREVGEAFNYMQSEIGRPEISAAVGYLLSYSCAALLASLADPSPMYERAMLANIERIASQFPNTPHARKLVATTQRLSAPLGSVPIEDSKVAHAHARHFDEVLRFLRHQRGLEVSPFYFGRDEVGAIHAVYV